MAMPQEPGKGHSAEQFAASVRKAIEKLCQDVPDFNFDAFSRDIDTLEKVQIRIADEYVDKARRGFLKSMLFLPFLGTLGSVGAFFGMVNNVFNELDVMQYRPGTPEWYEAFWKQITPYCVGGGVGLPALFAVSQYIGMRVDIQRLERQIPEVYMQELLRTEKLQPYFIDMRRAGVNPMRGLLLAIIDIQLRKRVVGGTS